MTDLQWLASYFADASHHFLLSGLAGWLAWLVTQTISCVSGLIWERGTHRKVSMVAVYYMIGISLLACVASALVAHWLLDYYASWYVTPLGPPLKIDTGPTF